MTDARKLPVVTAQQRAFIESLGFVPIYDADGRVDFLNRQHYARCVERGLISGAARQ